VLVKQETEKDILVVDDEVVQDRVVSLIANEADEITLARGHQLLNKFDTSDDKVPYDCKAYRRHFN
jgi:hypothetical protein